MSAKTIIQPHTGREPYLNWPAAPGQHPIWQGLTMGMAKVHAHAVQHYGLGEFHIPTGGTMLSLLTAEGVKPGFDIEHVLSMPTDRFLKTDRQMSVPRLVIPTPESPFYFGKAIDSSNMGPEHFCRIAEICWGVMCVETVNRIIVEMGTDTIAYAAAAVAQMITNPKMPIVFTAAMKNAGDPDTDAAVNLQNARIAAWALPPGVYICVGDRIIDARRGTKIHSSDLDSFRSVGAEDVAKIGHDVFPGCALTTNYPHPEVLKNFYDRYKTLREDWERVRGSMMDPYGLNLHLIQTEEEFRRLQGLELHGWEKFHANGMVPSYEQFRNPKEAQFRSVHDNQVPHECITKGYNPDWLKALLRREDVNGVQLSGLENVTDENLAEILRIIRQFSDQLPIVVMENPANEDSKRARKIKQAAERCGAVLSGGATVEYASFAVKRLLGAKPSVEEFKAAWQRIENIGGVGYVNTRLENTGQRNPLHENNYQPKHNITYIPLTPGYSPEYLQAKLERADVDAVVLGGYGAGNLPFEGEHELISVIKEFSDRKPIVLLSQCPEGGTDADHYETGKKALAAGAINAEKRTLDEVFQYLDSLLG